MPSRGGCSTERPDLRKRYYAILVTNDEGDEVCRLPLEIIH